MKMLLGGLKKDCEGPINAEAPWRSGALSDGIGSAFSGRMPPDGSSDT